MSDRPSRPANRLIHEKSPYLLQHAHNPVDWHAWGEEAFEKARVQDRPLLVSIGYSTCHWCHVMERESFENEATAELLNENFICVKVDREERPDVDQIYMSAVMALTGQGGWPLNVFLSPDLKPFYGGTYFPPDRRYGRPGFPEVLADIAKVWRERPEEVAKAGAQLTDFIAKTPKVRSGDLTEKALEAALGACKATFDDREGGFGGAPKFPRSMTLGFLLREHSRSQDPQVLKMVTTTLDKMLQGGIYDQVGGGFARYSTDDHWLVPHFEKMLYDNALLARAYLEGFQVTGDPEYARAARETFEYLFRDMTSPEGAFYSAEDADSEGEEGKFYVWTSEELAAALGQEDAAVFGALYGVTEKGNFEGKSILSLQEDLPSSLKRVDKDEVWWKGAREKVLCARAKRVRPHLDDKVLTSWNSLMISSLAYGYQVLGDDRYLEAAQKASSFLLKELKKDGRLLASFRKGPSDIQGFLDDYAFLQAAQLDLFESTFEPSYLEEAFRLGEAMKDLFWDAKEGAFFFTGKDQKDLSRLLTRGKESYDGAQPSGNSVAALSFLRLAELTGKKEWRETALAILKHFSLALMQQGSNHPQMLQAFQFDLSGAAEVFVTGPKKGAKPFLEVLWKEFLPHKVLVFAEEADKIAGLVPWVEGRKPLEGAPTAYVCRDHACKLPTTEASRMLELLTKDR
jgi:uncharacterized protein YyaL (SSP411 family)